MISTVTTDGDIRAVFDALSAYKTAHPSANVQVQRRNNVILRIRIIDPDFQNLDRVDRDNEIWHLLERLPEQVQSQITMLLLLTPDETPRSFANMEFENPVGV